MQDIVARHLDKTSAEISFEDGYPAMAPTPASQALFDQLGKINGDLGMGTLNEGDPDKRGAGDIAFVAHDVPGLVGMGLAGKGSHAVGETADLKSLDPQAERAAILILYGILLSRLPLYLWSRQSLREQDRLQRVDRFFQAVVNQNIVVFVVILNLTRGRDQPALDHLFRIQAAGAQPLLQFPAIRGHDEDAYGVSNSALDLRCTLDIDVKQEVLSFLVG